MGRCFSRCSHTVSRSASFITISRHEISSMKVISLSYDTCYRCHKPHIYIRGTTCPKPRKYASLAKGLIGHLSWRQQPTPFFSLSSDAGLGRHPNCSSESTFFEDPSRHQPLIGSHLFSRFLSEGRRCRAEVWTRGSKPWWQMTVGGRARRDKCVSPAICVTLLCNRTEMCGSLWLSGWDAVWRRSVSHQGCWRAWSQINLFSGSFSIRQLMKSLAEEGIKKQKGQKFIQMRKKTISFSNRLPLLLRPWTG